MRRHRRCSSCSASRLLSPFILIVFCSLLFLLRAIFGAGFNSGIGVKKKRGLGLVVRAGKAALCQTKRNRPRKSLTRIVLMDSTEE